MSKILIADDLPTNIKVLGELLRKQYEIIVANNGVKTITLACEKKPDLILLDVMMPEMDGFTACGILKQNPCTSDIPVIFITAKSEHEDIVKGFEVGAVDYLTKPFYPPEVLARVNTHIELKKVRDELQGTVARLTEALSHVKILSGLLPICAYCKKVRNDTGYWEQVETYVSHHSDASFSHGICPECVVKEFPEVAREMKKVLDTRG